MTTSATPEAAHEPVSALTGLLGSRVTVLKAKLPHHNRRFNGRSGVVVRLNENSNPAKDTGLWYVKLDATEKAHETTEIFWGHQLSDA